jgi:endonuclease YncB( thermonuclease family)
MIRRNLGLIALAIIGLMAARAWLTPTSAPNFPTITAVEEVIDGDTIRLDGHRVRIGAIDACEIGQFGLIAGKSWNCGASARRTMLELADGKPASCRVFDTDQYQRSVAQCEIGGRDIGLAMVEAGQAWFVTRWLPRDHPIDIDLYRQTEDRARAASAGIWSAEIEAPFQHRFSQ